MIGVEQCNSLGKKFLLDRGVSVFCRLNFSHIAPASSFTKMLSHSDSSYHRRLYLCSIVVYWISWHFLNHKGVKFMSHYNESEKILLLHQYVTSGLTLHEFSSRHGIPLSTFHRIYTEYGSPDVSSVAYLMKRRYPRSARRAQAQLLRERKAHEKRSNVLKRIGRWKTLWFGQQDDDRPCREEIQHPYTKNSAAK